MVPSKLQANICIVAARALLFEYAGEFCISTNVGLTHCCDAAGLHFVGVTDAFVLSASLLTEILS